jgi:hypothetical protein
MKKLLLLATLLLSVLSFGQSVTIEAVDLETEKVTATDVFEDFKVTYQLLADEDGIPTFIQINPVFGGVKSGPNYLTITKIEYTDEVVSYRVKNDLGSYFWIMFWSDGSMIAYVFDDYSQIWTGTGLNY